MKDTKTVDLMMGILFFCLGVAVIISSRSMPTATYGLGSGGYPMVVGVLMGALGLMQTVSTLFKTKGKLGKLSLPQNKVPLLRTAALVGSTFVYILLLPYLGFWLLTPFFLVGIMALYGYRRYLMASIVSVCVSIGIFFLFTRVFYIFLPTFRLFRR